MTAHKSLQFEEFTLDLDRLCLRGLSGPVDLRRKSFEVLRYLVEHAGRVVSKEEMMNAVWPDVTVGDQSLTQCISEVRHAIGDESQRIIKTVARRGYLMDVVISTEMPAVEPAHATTAIAELDSASPLPLPDRPSIAVLPFSNLSGDPDQEYFADGVVDDIITELSRFQGLFVIARNSSFQYKGKAADVRQVGRDLGVRYVLEGSVRRARDRVRIAAQLIDAESGGHLWAEKFDHDYADILAVQDGITESVAAAVEPEILASEGRRAARKSPSNLGAFDCCMRGIWHANQLGPQYNRQAESWLRRSIELDPALARAHAALSRVLSVRCWAGYSDDIERDLQASQAAVERALALDERDPAGHYGLSILSVMTRRHARALAAAQRAIDLNPNFALGYFALGETRIFMGLLSETIDPMMRCLRLTPRDPYASFFISLIALAHYHLGNYKQAVAYSETALQRRRIYVVMRTLAATLGQLGRIEEADTLLAEMEGLKPKNVERHWALTCPYADPAHEAHLLDGLRKAGWGVQVDRGPRID
jgi:adenylate cyclase